MSGSSAGFGLLSRVIVALAVLLALVATADALASAAWQEWNDGRLAPSAALLHGYELYSGDGEGPILGHVYGPISAFYYVPAALLSGTPDVAVMLGSVMSLVAFLLPAALLLRRGAAGAHIPCLAGLSGIWLYIFPTAMFLGPGFNIHADAPALGFGALACHLVTRPGAESDRWSYPAAALAVFLSVGSKQVMFALPVAIAAYIGLTQGSRVLRRFLAAQMVVGVAGLIAVAGLVDFRAMLFNMVSVPARHPWRGEGGIAAIVQACRDLAPRILPSVAVIAAALVLATATKRLRREDWRTWLGRNDWVLLILVGLANVPATLLGRVKVGGSLNALAFCGYFLVVGAALALVEARHEERPVAGHPAGYWARLMLLACLVVLLVVNLPVLRSAGGIPARIAGNPERAAYAFARAHQERIYYPFHPLVTLMSEGRAYHFSDAIYARELGGFTVTPRQFADGLPADLEIVATHRSYEDYSLRFLADFEVAAPIAELPGWRVFRRRGDPRR